MVDIKKHKDTLSTISIIITILVSLLSLIISINTYMLATEHEQWIREASKKKADLSVALDVINSNVKNIENQTNMNFIGNIYNSGSVPAILDEFELFIIDSRENRYTPITWDVNSETNVFDVGKSVNTELNMDFGQLSTDDITVELVLLIYYSDGEPRIFGDTIAYLDLNEAGFISRVHQGA